MSSTAITSEHGQLPLAPIDQPKSLFLRSLFHSFQKRYGLVPTAFRVLYARSPYIAFVSLVIYLGLAKCLRINNELRVLVQISLATRAGCTFCSDLQMAEAVRAKIGRERFRDMLSFESSTNFSPREKAALAYTKALSESAHIPDEIWTQLAAHFTERERVDIVWICAVEKYFHTMTLPLRIGSDKLSERFSA